MGHLSHIFFFLLFSTYTLIHFQDQYRECFSHMFLRDINSLKLRYQRGCSNQSQQNNHLLWLISTSCLISISDIRPQICNYPPRILISGRGFESGFEDQSTNPRSTFLESDVRPRVSSNWSFKLTREKNTNIVNRHQQITPSCLVFEFQMSDRTSETLGRGFKLSAKDSDIWPRV